jgi:hypothetical protein
MLEREKAKSTVVVTVGGAGVCRNLPRWCSVCLKEMLKHLHSDEEEVWKDCV